MGSLLCCQWLLCITIIEAAFVNHGYVTDDLDLILWWGIKLKTPPINYDREVVEQCSLKAPYGFDLVGYQRVNHSYPNPIYDGYFVCKGVYAYNEVVDGQDKRWYPIYGGYANLPYCNGSGHGYVNINIIHKNGRYFYLPGWADRMFPYIPLARWGKDGIATESNINVRIGHDVTRTYPTPTPVICEHKVEDFAFHVSHLGNVSLFRSGAGRCKKNRMYLDFDNSAFRVVKGLPCHLPCDYGHQYIMRCKALNIKFEQIDRSWYWLIISALKAFLKFVIANVFDFTVSGIFGAITALVNLYPSLLWEILLYLLVSNYGGHNLFTVIVTFIIWYLTGKFK